MRISHKNNFDFIRFSAAAAVWFVHCGIFYHLDFVDLFYHQDIYTLFQLLSRSAVYVFFIVSGYFVTASYENHPHLVAYFRNRALRILPAMFVVVLLSVFVLGPVATSLSLRRYILSIDTWRYLQNLLIFPTQYTLPGVFTDNAVPNISVNSSLWSLRYEVSCYIAVALLARLSLLRASVMAAIFAGFWFIRIYGNLTDLYVVPSMFVSSIYHVTKWKLAVDYCPGFAGGAFMYLMRFKIPLRADYFWVIFLVMCGSYLALGECMLFHLCLIYATIYFGFSKAPLQGFGKYGDFSYGMYIYAWPIQELFLHFCKHASFVEFLAMSSFTAMSCAVMSWYFIEKPALRYKV